MMFTRKTNRNGDKPKIAEVSGAIPAKKDEKPASTPSAQAKFPASLTGSGQMAPSIIGEDLSVEGNVVSKGEVQVEGQIKGDIHCASMVIGEKALIEGGVIAEDVIVRGRVVGSIRGQRVTLQASSHVEGDIYHQSLAIEQGAYFEGKSRRSDDPLAKTKSNVTTKPDLDSSRNSVSGNAGGVKPL